MIFTGVTMTEVDRAQLQVEQLIRRDVQASLLRLESGMPETEAESVALERDREAAEVGRLAVNALASKVPTFGPDMLSRGLLWGLARLHPHDQNKLVHCMLDALRDLARIETTPDGRNETAIARCRKLL